MAAVATSQRSAIVHPAGAMETFFSRRLAAAHPLRRACVWIAALGVAYAIAILFLALGGDTPGTAPWLAIPVATYFYWEALFIAPVIVGACLLAAAIAYLGGCALGGEGTFDATLVVIAYATVISTLFTLIPDLVQGVITTLGFADGLSWAQALTHPSPALAFVWFYIGLYAVAFLVLYPFAVRSALRLTGWRAIAAGWPAFVVYQLVLFVFIR
jgi:hypothetical protein